MRYRDKRLVRNWGDQARAANPESGTNCHFPRHALALTARELTIHQ